MGMRAGFNRVGVALQQPQGLVERHSGGQDLRLAPGGGNRHRRVDGCVEGIVAKAGGGIAGRIFTRRLRRLR